MHEFRYDMSFTHAEFRHYLVGATGDMTYTDTLTSAGGSFSSVHHGKGWRITLSPERIWRMPNTLLAMPRVDVHIELLNFEETEVKTWLERFHTYYRRGGG
jgi:hypothetical protein